MAPLQLVCFLSIVLFWQLLQHKCKKMFSYNQKMTIVARRRLARQRRFLLQRRTIQRQVVKQLYNYHWISLLIIIIGDIITFLNTPFIDQSVWCKPRAQGYWEAAKAGVFGDGWWYENLWMSKSTFDVLCNQLKPYIEKSITRYLYWQANCCYNLAFSNQHRIQNYFWTVWYRNLNSVQYCL